MSKPTRESLTEVWTYKGVSISAAGLNSSGIRWYALTSNGRLLADTKQGMRRLINDQRKAAGKQ